MKLSELLVSKLFCYFKKKHNLLKKKKCCLGLSNSRQDQELELAAEFKCLEFYNIIAC